MVKWVYMFTEGNADMRNLLGGKGANLAEMTNLGLPVPQGFTVTTEACTQYYEDGRQTVSYTHLVQVPSPALFFRFAYQELVRWTNSDCPDGKCENFSSGYFYFSRKEISVIRQK